LRLVPRGVGLHELQQHLSHFSPSISGLEVFGSERGFFESSQPIRKRHTARPRNSVASWLTSVNWRMVAEDIIVIVKRAENRSYCLSFRLTEWTISGVGQPSLYRTRQ
jgi:hypothetical protein